MITGPLFLKFDQTTKKIIVCQGGGDAGKTSDILKWLAKQSSLETLISTITGQDLPNLKGGALRLFQNYIERDPEIQPYIKTFNKSESTFHYYNGSLIEFKGFDNELDARGSERDYLFMNEGNTRTWNLFWQLQRKTRRKVFIDYNPTGKFWVHHKLLDPKTMEAQFKGKVQLYITDHRHNPHLSKEQHEDYENISDPELFRVYARGRTGQVKGAIYRFKKIDKLPTIKTIGADGKTYEKEMEFGFGIDFGYNSDKSAIVKVWYHGRKRYWKVLMYKSENEILEELAASKRDIGPAAYMAEILRANGCTSSTLVWGDHDKKYSNDFRKLGIPFRMARKGPNSLTMSISKVKEFENYCYDSPQLEEELKTYKWQTGIDILTGKEVSIAIPVDGMPDDALAGGRYFIYSHARRFSTDA